MAATATNLLKRAVTSVTDMSLVRRAVLLILVPAIVQAILLLGLVILEIETADFDPRRGAVERAINEAIIDFYLKDWATLRSLKNCLDQNQPVSPGCTENLKALLAAKTRLDTYWTEYADCYRKCTLFFLVPPEEYDQQTKSSNAQKASFGAICSAAERAIKLASKEAEVPVIQLPGAEATRLQEARVAERQAYNQLFSVIHAGQPQPFGPEEDARLRLFWSTRLLVYSGLDLVILVVAGILFVRDLLKRLRVLKGNSARLLLRQQLLPRMIGSDEISRLDNAFHDMKEAIDSSTEVYKLMMEKSTDLMCSVDKGGRIASMSEAAQLTIGYSPDDLVGTRLVEIIGEDSQQKVMDKLKEVTAAKSRTSFEAPVITKQGAPVELLWSAGYFSVDQSIFCITHDITETKRAERLQQELVQMVSHDLRSPLTSISGFYEFAERGVLGWFNEIGVRQMQHAKKSTSQMLTLVNDLLEVERLDSGMLEISMTNCSMQEVLQPAFEAVHTQAVDKNVTIQVKAKASHVHGDQPRLSQVLVNLLANGIKRSSPGGEIIVEAWDESGATKFSITDFGAPSTAATDKDDNLSPDSKQPPESALEMSHQYAPKQSGLGLKLEICKALVSLHSGETWVETGSVLGTRVTFAIPHQSGKARADKERQAREAREKHRYLGNYEADNG